MGKVFKDNPINEITLRKFERPSNMNKNELIRKFCISIGLLQPGDSRDVIVDILEVFLDAKNNKEFISSKEVEEKVKNLRKSGTTASNIRRQLLRLKRMNLIENVKNKYRLREFMSLENILKEIKRYSIEPTYERIKEYAKSIDKI